MRGEQYIFDALQYLKLFLHFFEFMATMTMHGVLSKNPP